LKIAMVLENPLFYGGGEIHAYEISKNFVRKGHTVDFIQLYGNPKKRSLTRGELLSDSHWIQSPRSKVLNVIYTRALWVYSFLSIPAVTIDLLRGKYDVVHLHNGGYASLLVSAVITKKVSGVKVFCTLHNNLAKHIDRRLIQRLAPNVDKFIAVSPAIQKNWLDEYHADAVFIPNGVDIGRFSPLLDASELKKRLELEDKFVVLSIGRLSVQKGIKYLIQASVSLKKHIPNIAVLICGRGEEESALKRQVDQMGLCDIVKFIGYVPAQKLPSYYAICDVFVLPSLFETFALTLLEALSVGKPVVCTRVGGAQEVAKQFEDSRFAILVNPANPEEIERGVLWYYSKADFAKIRNKKKMKATLADFSWENISERINKIYASFTHQ